VKCLFLLLALPAVAQDPTADPTLLGAGARSRPAYDGSASQYLEAVPVLRYWTPLVFARSTRGPLEGGLHVEVLPGLDAGVQLAYEQGRATRESTFLTAHDLPNIGRGGSYGAHLEWNGNLGPSPINVILRSRQNLKAGQGLQADLRLTAGVFQARGFSAGVVGEASWADARSNRTMYGITVQQAAISGLAAFSPGSGLLSASLGLIWSYDLARHWLLVGNLEGRRMEGDAARSPLTEKRSNLYATVGAAYRF
jgi:outer membrane scaffolding protein for murein synthesis (MipA/OmpV family)